MIHKTKAAMQGRQCHYQKLKQSQDTRVNAGGQSLSAPVIAGTAPLARFGGMSKSGHSRQGCTALAHTPFPQIWGELDQRVGCTAMQHTPEESRSFDRYPDIGYRCNESCIGQNQSYKNSGGQTPEDFQSAFMHFGYHSLSASLAFLRWRRLISPLAAVTRNPAVLSPSYFKSSISSITSWGIRTVVICDFAFFAPVAIAETPCVRCISVYAKKIKEKALKCISLWASLNGEGDIHLVNAKPGCARNTNRASDHNVIGANNMADLQHTQTRPEFTWRFLSASERYPNAKPLVIYLNASSEQEARDTMPGVNLIFAARLPFHAFQVMEVRHA